MYILYGMPRTRTLRVSWMLEEIGAKYEIQKAAPAGKLAKQLNVTGKVPILKGEDQLIVDSYAICSYLADKHQKLTFKPGSMQRAQMDSWVNFAIQDLEPGLWISTLHGALLPDEQKIPEILPYCDAIWQKSVAAMSRRMGDSEYICGNEFTIADIFLGHIGAWAKSFDKPVDSANVADYFSRVVKRPALARAMVKERRLITG